jgi:hypothetical protein
VSRDPDLLPSLRELGDRLGDAAAREIAAEHEGSGRRRRRPRWRHFLFGGLIAALVGAGAVTATDVFTGSGDPLPDERQPASRSGVLTDSAAEDPSGGLPWAVRVFVDDRGRECLQLGRLRDGVLGQVESGRFRPFSGQPNGACGDLRRTPAFAVVERRVQPAARTIVFGLTRSTEEVRVRIAGQDRLIPPGALGAYVTVYEGRPDLEDASVTVTVDGRRSSYPLG